MAFGLKGMGGPCGVKVCVQSVRVGLEDMSEHHDQRQPARVQTTTVC